MLGRLADTITPRQLAEVQYWKCAAVNAPMLVLGSQDDGHLSAKTIAAAARRLYSHTTSRGSLSGRIPRQLGCRSLPSDVRSL